MYLSDVYYNSYINIPPNHIMSQIQAHYNYPEPDDDMSCDGNYCRVARPEHWNMSSSGNDNYEPHYNVITRQLLRAVFWQTETGKRMTRDIVGPTAIKFYTTPIQPGARIVNAVSGFKESFRTGKREELNFFKVSLSTGELGSIHNSNVLFFESPMQYELHFHTSLNDAIKDKWNATREEYINETKIVK